MYCVIAEAREEHGCESTEKSTCTLKIVVASIKSKTITLSSKSQLMVNCLTRSHVGSANMDLSNTSKHSEQKVLTSFVTYQKHLKDRIWRKLRVIMRSWTVFSVWWKILKMMNIFKNCPQERNYFTLSSLKGHYYIVSLEKFHWYATNQ